MDALEADAKGLPWCQKCEGTDGPFRMGQGAAGVALFCVPCVKAGHAKAFFNHEGEITVADKTTPKSESEVQRDTGDNVDLNKEQEAAHAQEQAQAAPDDEES